MIAAYALREPRHGGKTQQLRIDMHRDAEQLDGADIVAPAGQEFIGVVMGLDYPGVCVPGNADGMMPSPRPSEKIEERHLTLPIVEGRKFRD